MINPKVTYYADPNRFPGLQDPLKINQPGGRRWSASDPRHEDCQCCKTPHWSKPVDLVDLEFMIGDANTVQVASSNLARLIREVLNLSKPSKFLRKSWGHLAVPCESSLVKSSVVVGLSSYVSQSYPNVDWSCSQVCLVSVSKPSFFDVISIVSIQSPVLELIFTHCLRASPPFFGVPQNPKVSHDVPHGNPEVLGCFTCSWSTKRSKGSFSPAFSLGRIEMFALDLTHKPILGKRWKGSSTIIICSYI